MINPIPAKLLLDVCRSRGYYTQLELPCMPPHLELDEKYFVCVEEGYKVYINGSWAGLTGRTEHPMFARMKKWLVDNGYLKTEAWWNGDTALKAFYLNNCYFEKGDRFRSPEPLLYEIQRKTKK